MKHSIITMSQLVTNRLAGSPSKDVMTFHETGETISAQNFLDAVSQYTQAFANLGLDSGARLGLLSQNRAEVVFVSTAYAFADLAYVAIHPLASLEDLKYIVEDAKIEALVFDPTRYDDLVSELVESVDCLKAALSIGPSRIGIDLLQLIEEYRPLPLPKIDIDPEGITRIGYSGGTTGRPKGITISHRANLTFTAAMLTEWEWPGANRHLACAPLSHGGGVVVPPILAKGGSVVVLPGFSPLGFLEAVEKYGITSTMLVPTMIYALLDCPDLGNYDLSSLEIIYYGASGISPTRLQEAIDRFGPIFFQFYGQAEAPMTVTTLDRAAHDRDDLNRLASCGKPVPWVHCALLDEDGQPVEKGAPGEICVQGPMVMSGYLNKPEETAEAFEYGWLHTGDIAVEDPDGYLRIIDRKKDMIISGGFNVFPKEVEDVINSHTAVATSAVIGAPHSTWGEQVIAVVVLRQGASVSEAELQALVKERKGAVQAPKVVVFADAIPVTALGKPDKKALRSRFC